MTKVLFLALILFSQLVIAAPRRIPESKSGWERGIDFRTLKQWRQYIFVGETKNRSELMDTNYHQLMLGSYYRITKRFKMGLFFQGEQGLRWDLDWRKQDGKWQWQDVGSRWDFSTILDATYNDKLQENWVWEIKTRFNYYHSREALLLRMRPGIRYFFMKHSLPWWQIYSQVETYIPVNYGVQSIYEYWMYIGALYHVNTHFSLGPIYALRNRSIRAYDRFEKVTGLDYKESLRSNYVGLSAVYLW
jgi:hypothetical protein